MSDDIPDDMPLNRLERLTRFTGEVRNLIFYWCTEYDMTIAEIVGVMQCEAFNIMHEDSHDDAVVDEEEEGEDSLDP